MSPMSLYTIRSFEPGDRNYVLSSWLNTAKRASFCGPGSGAWAKVLLSRESFFEVARPVVERFLAEGTVLVAADSLDETNILGWAAFWQGKVVWAYTSGPLRGRGVWKSLKKAGEAAGLVKSKPPKG